MARRNSQTPPLKTVDLHGVRACASCGMSLLRASELARLLDIPHSTVALGLKRAGLEAAVYEGERALYYGPLALEALTTKRRRIRW